MLRQVFSFLILNFCCIKKLGFIPQRSFFTYWFSTWGPPSCKWGKSIYFHPPQKARLCIEVCTYFLPTFLLSLFCNLALFSRQIKRHCAEPFTEYWTCIDYSGLQLFRRCRKQQAKFDECVLDKLGWVRPDLGELSKVRRCSAHAPTARWVKVGGGQERVLCEYRCDARNPNLPNRLIREWLYTILKRVYLIEISL